MKTSILLPIFCSLATCAYVKQDLKLPKFQLLADRSEDGSPGLSVTFPNGVQDRMVLSKFYSSDEDKLERLDLCHFLGFLADEPEAAVAMTGCPGQDDLEFTIMSKHLGESPMFKWNRDDSVELIENPFKNSFTKGAAFHLDRNETDSDWILEGDEEINPEIDMFEAEVSAFCFWGWGWGCGGGSSGGGGSNGGGSNSNNLPSSNTLQVRVGYGDGLRNKVGGNSQANSYIQAAFAHVQAYYRHSASLGTTVNVQRVGQTKHYPGRYFKADGQSLDMMKPTTKNELQGADLMVYVGYDQDYWGTIGLAFVGTVCESGWYDEAKQSMNEWRQTSTEMAYVLAHEIGHNLGMKHDFDDAHKGSGCDMQGIMSYGNAPAKWSLCSKSDFKAHYLRVKNRWCM